MQTGLERNTVLNRGALVEASEVTAMAGRKRQGSRSSVPVSEGEDRVCPNCHALASQGGCKDPEACARARAKAEAVPSREIKQLVDPADRQSLPLLMAGFDALDLLNIGLIVTTATGHLLLANQIAERILETHDGLELTPTGILDGMEDCCPEFGILLEQAGRGAQRGRPAREDAVTAVRRPSGKRPLTVIMRPLRDTRPASDNSAPAVLIFLLDSQMPVEAAEAELRQLYGFTSTEARLANLLMEGKNMDECCDLLKIRRSTGRTHLQHLFEKVGAQRQSELVALLLKSIGLVRMSNKDRRASAPDSDENREDAFLRQLMQRLARAMGGI